MSAHKYDSAAPTEADALLARESLSRLSRHLGAGQSNLSIHVRSDEQADEDMTLPSSAVRLLRDILAEMAEGHAVTVLPTRAELTTQQAADLLNVSRPYLIGLLEEERSRSDWSASTAASGWTISWPTSARMTPARSRIADELTADAQELGMGY